MRDKSGLLLCELIDGFLAEQSFFLFCGPDEQRAEKCSYKNQIERNSYFLCLRTVILNLKADYLNKFRRRLSKFGFKQGLREEICLTGHF